MLIIDYFTNSANPHTALTVSDNVNDLELHCPNR